ncbi:MAG: S1-C subfamily serine protease [Candidatus Azotimanducaceae bacterium]|jgi:S1-C subfamily serine protease
MKTKIIALTIAGLIVMLVIFSITDRSSNQVIGNVTGGIASYSDPTNFASPTATLPASEQPNNVFLTDDESNNIAVFRDASPSVVFVTNTLVRRQLFSMNVMETPRGSGTGLIWDKDGLIVTNYHVILGANRIIITLDSGNSFDAEVVGTAPEKDIALLRIQAPGETLKPINLGDSNDLSVGRKVLAIGNPFALDTTLTVGVVSALGREIKAANNRTIKDVIQTDAAINPGNSGGPLLNSSGQLVGVNTAIFSPSGASAGIGFAIPVNTVRNLIPQLIEYGKLYRPVLGIETLTDYWAKRLGVKGIAILSVKDGLAAERAGMIGVREDNRGQIHLGDVIIAINDQPVTNEDSLLTALEKFAPGDQVQVTTLRDEKIVEYNLVLTAPDA